MVPAYQHLHQAVRLSGVACAAPQVIYYSSTTSWQCPSKPMAAGVGTYVVVASDLYQGGAACGQCMSVVSSPFNSAVTPFIAQVRCSSAWGFEKFVVALVSRRPHCSCLHFGSGQHGMSVSPHSGVGVAFRDGGGLAVKPLDCSCRTSAGACCLQAACPRYDT